MKSQKHLSNDQIGARIESAMGAVMRSSGYEAIDRNTPLSALVAAEDGICLDEEALARLLRELDMEPDAHLSGVRSVQEVRAEVFRQMLDWLFERGFDPRVVVQRVFALAKELRPGAIADMPEEAMALLLNDGGRATVNARGKLVFAGLRAALGGHTALGTHHKTLGSVERMRVAQKGNRNRASSVRKAA